MSMKKILLLASMALALVAFALPASASALTVRDNNASLSNKTVAFSGKAKFETLGTGIECSVSASVKVNVDEIDLTAFTINTASCVFFGFLYEECQFENPGDTVTGLPWGIDLTGADTLTLTGSTAGGAGKIDGRLTNAPGRTCFTTQNDLTVTDVTLDVETSGGFISAVELRGEVTSDNSLGNNLVSVGGTLSIEAAGAGTYKIS